MYYEQRLVTPEQAAEWREGAAKNRKLHSAIVKQYENDILAGNFTETSACISFNRKGTLIDGNHRLQAIINTGIPTLLSIAHDVPDNAVFDRGIKRTIGESLWMRNLINDGDLSSPAVQAVVNRYLRTARKETRMFSEEEIADFINKYAEQIRKSITISDTGANECICRRAPVQAAILGALFDGVSDEKLYAFTKCVNSGFSQNGLADSSAIVLRNYLLKKKADGHTGGQRNAEEICMTTELAIKDYVSQMPRKMPYRKLTHVYIHPETRP